MAQDTQYAPVKMSEFEGGKISFSGLHAKNTLMAGQSNQNIDLQLADDMLLTGGKLIVHNGAFGDTAKLQVCAPDGQGGLIVASEYVNWGMAEEENFIFEVPYPAKLATGLTLRLVYSSTGIINPFICINYILHKVLI